MTAERIRDLNDAFRRSLTGGKVMMTAGIATMTDEMRAKVFDRVRTFEAFHGQYGDAFHELRRELDKLTAHVLLQIVAGGEPAISVFRTHMGERA